MQPEIHLGPLTLQTFGIAFALARTRAKISDAFGVLPGFAYYDYYDSRNAYATERTRLNRADGTVSVRTRAGGDQGSRAIDAFITSAREEIAHKGKAVATA